MLNSSGNELSSGKKFSLGIFWIFLASVQVCIAGNVAMPTLLYHHESGSSAPFAYATPSGVVGAIPDIVRHLLQPMGYEVVVYHTPEGRIYSEMSAGRGDLLLVTTQKGLNVDDYPSNILICPSVIGRIPVGLYFLTKPPVDTPIVEMRIGAIRLAPFKRSLAREFQFKNLTRFSRHEQVFKALMTERIDAAILDPYTVKSLSLIHQRPLPIRLDVDLGGVTAYIGLSKAAEERYGIFEELCQQAAIWEEQGKFADFLVPHLLPKAYSQ